MQPETVPHPPVNHVFVDLENVKSIDSAVIGGKNLRFYLFLGPQNKKLDVEVVECLLENAQVVQMIRSPKPGKNALDFVLAYHLGQAVLGEPKGYFHIISKDTGFDALVDLLKSRHVKVKRHDDWGALHLQALQKPVPLVVPVASVVKPAKPAAKPAVKPASKPASKPAAMPEPIPALSEMAGKLLENLKKSPKARPKKEKTLLKYALSFNGRNTTEAGAAKMIDELKRVSSLVIDDKGGVVYQL